MRQAATFTDPDFPLVQASKNGDIAAFEELVKHYERKLLRVAQNVTHNVDDAQEVVQEAFFNAYQNLDRFRGTAHFSTWLIRIALNESFMKMRKLRNVREVLADDLQIQVESLTSHDTRWVPNPEDLCSSGQFQKILRNAVEDLTPSLRIVFLLRDMEQLAIEETAEALKLSKTAVKARLFRARLRLRDKLNKYFARRAAEHG